MTTADVERLYVLVESLRSEVVGYRADLNGRLRALEIAQAEDVGGSAARSMSRNQMVSWVVVVAAIVGISSTILDQILIRV